MRKWLLTIGLGLSLAVTGCSSSSSEEKAESSLESLVEVESEETSEETEEPRRPPETGYWADCVPKPLESSDDEKAESKVEAEDEKPLPPPIPPIVPTGGEDCCIPRPSIPDETEPEYIIKAEGDEWIDNSDELPVVPYKDKLTEDVLKAGGFWWEDTDSVYCDKWIDCGAYYKVKDVEVVSFYDSPYGGLDFDYIEHFDELYIMKEGTYIFGGEVYTNLEDWLNVYHYAPRFNLEFDENGYVIGFMDAYVC